MEMLLIVILVLILLIALFLWKFKQKPCLRGGEFTKYTYSDREVVPSLSLIETLDSCQEKKIEEKVNNEFSGFELFEYVLLKCMKRLEKINSFKWNGISAYCNDLNTAHLVSDANIDMIGVYLDGVNIDFAFAVCEWHGDVFRAESNYIISIYQNNMFRCFTADERIQKYLQFHPFYGTISPNDQNEIKRILRGINMEVHGTSINIKLFIIAKIFEPIINNTNITSDEQNRKIQSIQKHEEIINEKQYIIPLTKDFLSDMEKQLRDSSSQRVKSICGLTTPTSRKDHDVTKSDIVRSLCLRRQLLLKAYKDEFNPCVQIYIEYSYGSSRKVTDLYPLVHRHTHRVITDIIKHHESEEIISKQLYIYCMRFQLEQDQDGGQGRLTFPSNDYNLFPEYTITTVSAYKSIIDNVKIYYYDECSYPSIKIPETTSEFSYDEQLFITRNSIHYSIQIEHSEDGSDHKSNMVEFIGRNLSQLISLDEMQMFLKMNMHEIIDEENRFKWNYCRNQKQIKIQESVIYKAFHDMSKDLFNSSPYTQAKP